jgi:hypothetical protein
MHLLKEVSKLQIKSSLKPDTKTKKEEVSDRWRHIKVPDGITQSKEFALEIDKAVTHLSTLGSVQNDINNLIGKNLHNYNGGLNYDECLLITGENIYAAILQFKKNVYVITYSKVLVRQMLSLYTMEYFKKTSSITIEKETSSKKRTYYTFRG